MGLGDGEDCASLDLSLGKGEQRTCAIWRSAKCLWLFRYIVIHVSRKLFALGRSLNVSFSQTDIWCFWAVGRTHAGRRLCGVETHVVGLVEKGTL